MYFNERKYFRFKTKIGSHCKNLSGEVLYWFMYPTCTNRFLTICVYEMYCKLLKSNAIFINGNLTGDDNYIVLPSWYWNSSMKLLGLLKPFPWQRDRLWLLFGPRQANLVLIAYASSEGSGEPVHPRSLARTFAARSYKQWVKRNIQTESQIPESSEWLGMRS